MSESKRPAAEPVRCFWAGPDLDYQNYHDLEWGRPETADIRLFEKVSLEGFQSGLSWLTILRKRENFRTAFADFDFRRIAEFDDTDVERLVNDAGIIRHRGKINSVLNNARRALELVGEFDSLSSYFWKFQPEQHSTGLDLPSQTQESQALAKDLKKRGWSFVGPTTAYAFMQAMGLVNDHEPQCFVRAEVEQLRRTGRSN